MNRSMPGLPVHHQLPEFTQSHVHRVGDAIQPSHALLSPSLAPNPSQRQGLFQWVNSLHEVAKVLEFQLNISPSKEHPGLISFRMDWLDLLAVWGTLKNLLQHNVYNINVPYLARISSLLWLEHEIRYLEVKKNGFLGLEGFGSARNARPAHSGEQCEYIQYYEQSESTK